jgi:hypothetical protein
MSTPANIADIRVALLEGFEPFEQIRTLGSGVLRLAICKNEVQRSEPGGTGDRMATVGIGVVNRAERTLVTGERVGHSLVDRSRAERLVTRGQSLGEAHYIRLDPP